jgi:hypothetical protein
MVVMKEKSSAGPTSHQDCRNSLLHGETLLVLMHSKLLARIPAIMSKKNAMAMGECLGGSDVFHLIG